MLPTSRTHHSPAMSSIRAWRLVTAPSRMTRSHSGRRPMVIPSRTRGTTGGDSTPARFPHLEVRGRHTSTHRLLPGSFPRAVPSARTLILGSHRQWCAAGVRGRGVVSNRSPDPPPRRGQRRDQPLGDRRPPTRESCPRHHASSTGSATAPDRVRHSAVASGWENCGDWQPVDHAPVGRCAAHLLPAAGTDQLLEVDEPPVGGRVGLGVHGGLPDARLGLSARPLGVAGCSPPPP